ncbi:heme A synthase [Euhalothece natronophila Z-M001]|uniref:Heme A synthase n=1 Tax=Euhalothece natronophila Z-M001 TaxID=522448 RepID=A0A5B8NJE5_9CHRO|nr:heme A synthase [Euhalothece natronophila]QDZ39056.1 heme A synthase [Euhalothece natronophila Z-M001]
MTESVIQQKITQSKNQLTAQQQVRRLIWKISIATFILMAIGSATRVMDAGLACPDWPLCYGQIVPSQQMNLQVFLEWFHRLDAALIGLSTLFLAGFSIWYRQSLPRWLPWASVLAVILVSLQGLLGGLTVTELLRFDIVTAHLGTALLFFGLLVGMGTALLPYQGTTTAKKLPWLGGIAVALVYGQSLLGGLIASRWAVHQCYTGSQLCSVMNSHLLGVLPASLATLAVVIFSWRTPALHPALRKISNASGVLLILQILVGTATFHFHLQVEPLTVTHQAVGAALFGGLVAYTVLAVRDAMTSSQSV